MFFEINNFFGKKLNVNLFNTKKSPKIKISNSVSNKKLKSIIDILDTSLY